MIQAPLPKPVEAPKAQAAHADAASVDSNIKSPKAMTVKGAKETAKTKEAHAAKESKAKEFVSELEASLKEATNPEVKPVHVSAEQALELPSTLVQPQGSVETASPKVFDPALTKGVEKLIQPKTSEVAVPAAAAGTAVAAVELTDAQVLELANMEGVTPEVKAEIQQAMLKTPQVQSGRAPAIDFAKAEIDPQLLGNEDFVAQKNLVAKKPVTNAYGMKQLPVQQQQQQQALESGLQPVQVVKETSTAETPMNSQQFILGLQSEKSFAHSHEVEAPVKTFDMNNIKSSQPTEIMNQITDYVVQAKAAKEPTVNMRVNHDELGMIDITVSKIGGVNNEAIAVNIGTHSADGKNFFQQNSKDLFSHLTTAGLNVSDLKVETPTQTAKNDFDFGSQSGRNNSQHGSEKQFGSEQNQRRHESERRQDLWKLLNKEAA